MKSQLTALGLALSLTACGGGGGSGSPSAGDQTPTSGTIADSTSTTYASSLQAFAEVFRGVEFLLTTNDLVLMAGKTTTCPKGGSLSYTAPVETLSLCQLKFPNEGAYSGSFSATVTTTGNTTNVAAMAINSVKIFDPTVTTKLQFTFASGTFAGSDTDNGTNDQIRLTSGLILVNAGTRSNYTVGQFNTLTTNDGASLVLQQNSASGKLLQVVKGINTYDVNAIQAVTMIGNNFPSAGGLTINYATATGCSPIVVTYLPANQFTMACGGHSITKNWTDMDVVAARAASII